MANELVVFVPGASSGIGKACAEFLSAKGHIVYGTVRKHPPTSGSFHTVLMDVTQEPSVEEAVKQVMKATGRMDVVVHCAGVSVVGAIEETSLSEASTLFETNFWGVVRVCQAVIPIMRSQRKGTFLVVGSMAGLMGLPFEAFYSASKFALEGFIEALRMETRPFGIEAALIDPGDFRTEITKNRTKTKSRLDVYASRSSTSLSITEHHETHGQHPVQIARLVNRLISRRRLKPRYVVGPFDQRLAATLKHFLPATWFERIVMSHYKIG